MEDNDLIRQLRSKILYQMGAVIDSEMVHSSFPHMERPSLEDMEEALTISLTNEPMPEYLEQRISYKPTQKMLKEFCNKLELEYEYIQNENGDYYLFKLKRFLKE